MTSAQWALLLIAQAIWSGSYVAMKIAGAEMPVGAVVVLRYGIATIGYLPLLWRLGMPKLERRDWALAGVVGALDFALAPSLKVASLQHTQAVDVSILAALEPVLTVAMAAVILRERLDGRTWFALGVGAVGMVVLSAVGGVEGGGAGERLFGNGLFVLAVIFEVAVTITGGRLARRYNPLTTLALMKIIGFLVAAVAYSGVWSAVDLGSVSAPAWSSLVYLGWCASLFSYSVWFYVLKTAPVNQVALTLFVQPLAGAALGVWLADETISLNTIIGASLICGVLFWQQLRRRPA